MKEEEQLLDEVVRQKVDLKEFEFPITFEFKIGTLANDFIAKDANGRTIAYVRQKMFKFKEAIMIYTDDSKKHFLYKIDADRIIDFNASYEFTDKDNEVLGSIGRKGMKSLWKANYEIFDPTKNSKYIIREENPWAKVLDVLLSEVPLLGIFTGYLFNPKFGVKTKDDNTVARLSKQPSFFGRKFKLDKLTEIEDGDDERLMLSLMMMVLLERRRG